ncbi:MAG: hypothetical protein KDD53_04205 [Bdellovibrionales bacterium]|nr:hypothetical protein [Bdellovibrionales bacterium]
MPIPNLDLPVESHPTLNQRYQGSIEKVMIVFAMEEEGSAFVEKLGLQEVRGGDLRLPFRTFHKEIGAIELVVRFNGLDSKSKVSCVGTEYATLNTHLGATDCEPNLIVSAGTAGGFDYLGGEIGDVYLSDGELGFHDHRIPIPGYDEYGLGNYPSTPITNLPLVLNAKLGRVSSGNSLDSTPRDLDIMRERGIAVKDMEAAAVAKVADALGIAFISLKSITDLVDSPEQTPEVFLRNLQMASERLQTSLVKLIDHLSKGRKFEEL